VGVFEDLGAEQERLAPRDSALTVTGPQGAVAT
jgi:hypothetical protein